MSSKKFFTTSGFVRRSGETVQCASFGPRGGMVVVTRRDLPPVQHRRTSGKSLSKQR
jgi:hypothetical protein